MGLRFHELDQNTEEQLDEFIVGYLRDRLSKGNTIAHRPGWIRDRRARGVINAGRVSRALGTN